MKYIIQNIKVYQTNLVMEKTYSYFATLFTARFIGYMNQRKTTLNDFLINKQVTVQNKIPLTNFVKLIKTFCPQLNSLQIQEMFNEFSNKSPELKTQSFVYAFGEIAKKIPKKPQKKIQVISQEQKQTSAIALKKLQMFMEHSDAQELFNQCDLSESSTLNIQQFNKLLIISQIPELKEKSIRKLILQMIFSKFPAGINKQNFFSLFRIDPKKQKEKLAQKKKLPQMKKIPHQRIIPIKTPSLQKKKISEPVKERQRSNTNNNLFMKKKPNPVDVAVLQAKKIPSFQDKRKQEQYNHIKTTHDELHTNLNELLPRAMKYFRNGQPDLQDMSFMESLQQYLQTNKIFVDSQNPATHMGKYMSAYQIFNGNRYALFQMAPSVIHREKSRIGIARQIQPKDIMQGNIGDCYFLSAIASLVSLYPQMISERFLVNCNQSHLMGVKLFIDGQWIIYRTDDSFPVEYNKPIFAKPHGRQIWVMLLQKCWAKAHKSYRAIQSGTPREGFLALTGAPCQYINPDDKQYKNNIKEILQNAVDKRYVTTVSGNDYLSSLTKDQQSKIGLVSDHSYSFLKLFKIGNETVFKLRNPWGKEVWNGRWSYNSDTWTPQLRQKYNYKRQTDDGSFYIDWNNFIKHFGNIVICKANPTFLHSSVRTQFNSRKSNYFQFTIHEESVFNFTIYQTSKRINNKYSNYQFSPARIIILKRRGEGFQYKGSMNKKAYDCSVEVKLTPGIYVLAAKIKWKFSNLGNEAVITSYGNERISMQPVDRSISTQFKKYMILTYMKKFPGQIKKYENIKIPEAFNEKFFDIRKGIGYIRFCNQSNKQFQTTLSIDSQGLKVIKPAQIPTTFNMKTGSQYVVGFFVSAQGYSYQSSQSIKYTVST